MYYDLENQRARRAAIHRAVTQYDMPAYDDQGRYIDRGRLFTFAMPGSMSGGQPTLGTREHAWLALSFISDGTPEGIKKGNAILRELGTARMAGSFSLRGLTHSFTDFPERIDDDVKEMIKKAFINHFDGDILSGRRVNEFGAETNFPMMDTGVAIIGGHFYGRQDVYERGVECLRGTAGILARRATVIEFTSPTYLPIHAQMLADIMNYAPLPADVRKLAEDCLIRIAADLLSHYHPGLGRLCGPYGRAYMVDMCGHTHCSSYWFHILFGDRMPFDLFKGPLQTELGAPGEIIHNSIEMMHSEIALYALTEFRLSPELVSIAFEKHYPVTVKMKANKMTRVNDEGYRDFLYTTGDIATHSYMTADYAFGSCSREHSATGQTQIFHLLYKKKDTVACQADIGAVCTGLYINESYMNLCEGKIHSMTCDGRRYAVSAKNRALTAYRGAVNRCRGVSKVCMNIILPSHEGDVDELWLCGSRVALPKEDGVFFTSDTAGAVALRGHNTYAGFVPFEATDCGRKHAMTAERRLGFVLVSFWNYDGPERDFDPYDFMFITNGYAAMIGSKAEDGSFEAFREKLARVKVRDVGGRKVGSNRYVCGDYGDMKLELEVEPMHEGYARRTLNGREINDPTFWSSDFDVAALPFYSPEWNSPTLE